MGPQRLETNSSKTYDTQISNIEHYAQGPNLKFLTLILGNTFKTVSQGNMGGFLEMMSVLGNIQL